MLDILAFSLNILIWSISPFYSKDLLEKITPFNFTILRGIFFGILSLLIALFINNYSILTSFNHSFYIILTILIICSFIASNIYNYLLKKYNANIVQVIINPLIIFLSALIGSIFFNEKFTNQMWCGTFIIMIGLIIFIKGKK